uniref:DNA-directed RNA polymerase II largest subunit, putative n=1 Tax=Arundo donax TaxID=35708 RepID=A0A0A9FH93_ARUDO
MRMIQNSSRL